MTRNHIQLKPYQDQQHIKAFLLRAKGANILMVEKPNKTGLFKKPTDVEAKLLIVE